MYITRAIVPADFQSGEHNCQSIVEHILGYFDPPEKKYSSEQGFILEWEHEDESDADDMKESVETILPDANSLNEDDNAEPDYSGIRVVVVEQ